MSRRECGQLVPEPGDPSGNVGQSGDQEELFPELFSLPGNDDEGDFVIKGGDAPHAIKTTGSGWSRRGADVKRRAYGTEGASRLPSHIVLRSARKN